MSSTIRKFSGSILSRQPTSERSSHKLVNWWQLIVLCLLLTHLAIWAGFHERFQEEKTEFLFLTALYLLLLGISIFGLIAAKRLVFGIVNRKTLRWWLTEGLFLVVLVANLVWVTSSILSVEKFSM